MRRKGGHCKRKLESFIVCFREPFFLVEDVFLALIYRASGLELDVKTNLRSYDCVRPGLFGQ